MRALGTFFLGPDPHIAFQTNDGRGVDDATFSSTGEAFSTIVIPHANTHTAKALQEDDCSLACAPRPVCRGAWRASAFAARFRSPLSRFLSWQTSLRASSRATPRVRRLLQPATFGRVPVPPTLRADRLPAFFLRREPL